MFQQMSSRIRFPHNSRDLLHAANLRHGTIYFPSEERRAVDFVALKNPTASAGFEPANLGTKGQHATSRPPKPIAENRVKEIKQYQEKWLQHLQRMDTNRLPKQALQYKPKERRHIGRSRKRWRGQFYFEDTRNRNQI
jgi:hypothetical protein